MRILYDFQAFYRTRVGGVSRYFHEVMNFLPKDADYFVSLLTSDNIYIPDSKWHCNPFPNNKLGNKLLKICNEWNSLQDIRKRDYDIIHVTDSDNYYVGKTRKPVVATIHDMIWEKYHLNPYIEEWRKHQCETADMIITVSEKTKEDLLEIYHINPSKVVTIYHGVSPVKFIKTPTPYGRYVLYVGKRNGYKNFVYFLKAMALLRQKDNELNIVCTGDVFSKDEYQLITELQLNNNIYQKFVSDEELFNLYANAEAFVYPSEYEGFGIPILEAFYCHCPVVLANASCFPEIAQDAAVYFETRNIESQAYAIRNVIYDSHVRKDVIAKGDVRLENYSWEKSAQQHYNLYKTLI